VEAPESLRCPCGAAAPADLPEPGKPPVSCALCATPLVAPGRIAAAAFERGLGAALLVAVGGAALWAVVCFFGRTGAPWSLAVAGLAVGIAARAAARARGGRVQLAAGLALGVFFLLGEFLSYRHALLPRLEAMHAAEGAPDADVLAEREAEQIRDDVDFEKAWRDIKRARPLDAASAVWPSRYASLEATRDLFLAMAAGVAAALWVTRARPAVAAFDAPRRVSAPSSTPSSEASQGPPALPAQVSEPMPPSSPASDGPAPAAAPPGDAP
jgi:hypothetical protein